MKFEAVILYRMIVVSYYVNVKMMIMTIFEDSVCQ
jgi:hypothetical protein